MFKLENSLCDMVQGNMETRINCGTKILNAYVAKTDASNTCILFLSGGSVHLGKERFRKWQDDLVSKGVNSVSFDYSGVNGSGDRLDQSSLKSRIEESVCVADWMRENVPVYQYVLYGVSMGGYVALALTNEKPDLFQKLILHAPAAYSSKAHTLHFGQDFTNEIRKEGSWKNSLSFAWFQSFKGSVLFVDAEQEEVIPAQLSGMYTLTKEGDTSFRHIVLNGAKHNIWDADINNFQYRDRIYKEILRLF